MGYNTEFNAKIVLRKDTPKEVLALLDRVITKGDLGLGEKVLFSSEDVFVPEIDHPFFKCERWYMLFCATNWDEKKFGSKFYFSNGGYPVLEIQSEFKNYDSEIFNFINWIHPYVAGHRPLQYIGWSRGETQDNQSHHWIKRAPITRISKLI